MKILVIYPEYKKTVTGGQVYDHYFIDRIVSNGKHQVDFLTDDMLCSNSKYLYNFSYLQKFTFVRKYDLVLTNSRLYPRLLLLLLFLRIFSKTKVISIHHHFNFLIEQGIKNTIHKKLELRFLKLSYATIIPSPYVRQLFCELLPQKKLFYVELGIKKTPKQVLANKTMNNNQLLYVGTIERRKGLIYLVMALNILNKKGVVFHCNIVGKTIEKDYLMELKTAITQYDLQNKVSFTDWVSDEQLNEYYGNAFCFVLPSLLEGYGMVLLEAMSYGLPIVAFDNSAMPFTVKNNINGLLAENKNSKQLAENIFKIITNQPFRENLSNNAIDIYKYFRTFGDMDKEIDLLCKTNFEIL